MCEVTVEVRVWAGVCIGFKKMLQWEIDPLCCQSCREHESNSWCFSPSPWLGAWKVWGEWEEMSHVKFNLFGIFLFVHINKLMNNSVILNKNINPNHNF